MGKIKNRPEIDGLRAVAVMPVVLYHSGLAFPGGYVGVDVFFVISGYLITSLILTDLKDGTFRFLDFWARRIRRILPALALVVLACLLAAWWMFIPADFEALGRSVAYQSLLISNVYFWKTIGYFSPGDTQPLLHTWSLAVEEQFYLLFPFLLVALAKWGKRVMVLSLGVLTVMSFGLGAYATRFHPTAAFYLLPSRAWELSLGALLAASPDLGRPLGRLNESLSWLGFSGILIAASFYTKDTPFPGYAALLPCLGAALVIWTNSSSVTFVGKLLSVRPMVFVGLISYSLYLWHWPLLVFSKYWYTPNSESSQVYYLRLVALSLLLAAVSWKFVETPFRKRMVVGSRRQAFAFAGIALAGLLLAGLEIKHARGFRSHWPPVALRYLEARDDKDFRVELDLASVKKRDLIPIGVKSEDHPIDLLIWGDSHAMAILHVLDALCLKHNVRALAATHSATIPFLDYPCTTIHSLREDTVAYNWAIASYVKERQIKNVLLVAAWNGYLPPTADQDAKKKFTDALAKTIGFLHEAGARVILMKDVPKQKYDVPRVLATAARFGKDTSQLGLSVSEHRARTAFVSELFDSLASPSVILLDPTTMLTNEGGLCRAEMNGRALYFDQHHLTIHGEMQLQPLFEPIFQEGALSYRANSN